MVNLEVELIERLTRLVGLGGRFWLEAGRLAYQGPKGALTPDDETFFATKRDTIVTVLSRGLAARCHCCGGDTAIIRLDDRRDESGNPHADYSDLWAGECPACGETFSQGIAARASATGQPLIFSELVN